MTTTALSSTLAQQINQEHQLATDAAKTAVHHARRCGELLLQAKGEIGHGGFLSWLSQNCSVGERQARTYMRIAENWTAIESKSEPGAVLTIKGAVRLFRGPTALTPEQKRWIERSVRSLEREYCRAFPTATDADLANDFREAMRQLGDEGPKRQIARKHSSRCSHRRPAS